MGGAERRGGSRRGPLGVVRCGALLAALLAACAGDRRALLEDAVEAYQHALRWGDLGGLASYLGERPRQRLLARGAAWRELRIVEVTLTRVEVLGAGTARALVQVEWYALRSGSLGATLVAQRWVDGADGWQLVEQRVIGGVPLPVLALP